MMLDFVESFSIAVLFRTDLARAGLTFDQIEAMSNLDMVNIANKMGRRYLQGSFLSDLEQAVSVVLSEKEHKGDEALDRGA
jgi:hypothetical protein